MNEFLKLFDEQTIPMRLEITYSDITDWDITIWETRPNKESAKIVDVQNSDMEYCFAKAQIELKDWLLDPEGTY